MARVLILLCLVCAVAAQVSFFQIPGVQTRPSSSRSSSGRSSSGRSSSSSSSSSRRAPRPSGSRPRPRSREEPSQKLREEESNLIRTDANVDDRLGSSEYHFSWRHKRNRKFTGQQAFRYCSGLGSEWTPVNINTNAENSFVTAVIMGEHQDYIWTGGAKRGGRWMWADGTSVDDLAWSHTGGRRPRIPQPDNRDGNEDCLSVLNNVYRDGIKWHDVACHHTKPTICERKA